LGIDVTFIEELVKSGNTSIPELIDINDQSVFMLTSVNRSDITLIESKVLVNER
jgi:hypothetical protein